MEIILKLFIIVLCILSIDLFIIIHEFLVKLETRQINKYNKRIGAEFDLYEDQDYKDNYFLFTDIFYGTVITSYSIFYMFFYEGILLENLRYLILYSFLTFMGYLTLRIIFVKIGRFIKEIKRIKFK